jgi:hypothetical protein
MVWLMVGLLYVPGLFNLDSPTGDLNFSFDLAPLIAGFKNSSLIDSHSKF